MESGVRCRRMGRLARRRHTDRHHVPGFGVLHRRDVAGTTAHGSCLFFCPDCNGPMGRVPDRLVRKRRIRGDAGGCGFLHRLIFDGNIRNRTRFSADLVDIGLYRLRGSERGGCRLVIPGDAGGDGSGACGAAHFLGQRHPEHGLQPLGSQYRGGRQRTA